MGEQLDKHPKDRQALHPDLTMTGMYNVLEKLKSGEPLTAKERDIHDKGLVSILRQIHEELDAAVFAAYGWPATLSDEAILERLVALNHERAEEEKRGLVRWLRPEFQAPEAARPAPAQTELAVPEPIAAAPPDKGARQPWPATLPEQVQAIRVALAAHSRPVTAAELAHAFAGPRKSRTDRTGEILQTLAALGQARAIEGDRFTA